MNKSIAHIVHIYVCVVRTFQVYSLSNFEVHAAALLPIVARLYIRLLQTPVISFLSLKEGPCGRAFPSIAFKLSLLK